MAKIGEVFTLAAGVLAGKKEAEIKAAGAVLKAQGKFKTTAGKLGAQLGKITGSALLKSAAEAAEKRDQADTEALLKDQAGISLDKIKAVLVAAAAAVVLFMVAKWSKK